MRPGFDAFLISTSIPTPYLRKSKQYLHNIYLHSDRSIHWQEWPKGPLCPALAGESEGRNQPQSPLRSHSILPNPRVTAAIVDIYNVFSYCASLYWVITCQDFNEDIVNRKIFYINELSCIWRQRKWLWPLFRSDTETPSSSVPLGTNLDIVCPVWCCNARAEYSSLDNYATIAHHLERTFANFEVSQSPGWKLLLSLSHLRIY